MKKIVFLIVVVCSFSICFSQWEHCTEDLNTGYIKTIGIFDDKIFVGKDTSGIYYSSNNGDSWSNNYTENTGIYTFTSIDNLIFAGTDNSQILLSSDKGFTWIAKPFTLFDTWIYLTATGNKLFAGTMNGVFSSSDFGDSWVVKNNGFPTMAVNSIFSIGSNVYAGTNIGLYLSTDYGESWTLKNSGLAQTITSIIAKDDNIYAASYSGMYYSSDNGDTWIFKKIDTSYKYTYSLVLDGNDIIAGTSKGVYTSWDKGDNWHSLNEGLTNSFAKALALGSYYLFAGTNHGIYRLGRITGIEKPRNTDADNFISPNPATDYIVISVGNVILSEAKNPTRIYNTLGECVIKVEQTSSSVQRIDVSHLSPGVYFVRVVNDVKKFVKY